MDLVHASYPQLGADLVARSLRAVNATVLHMHARKLTKSQIVMFTFADMMAMAEVAGALVEKAADLGAGSHPRAGYFGAVSRVFARKLTGFVRTGAERCATGLAAEDARGDGAPLLDAIGGLLPPGVGGGLWAAMAEVGRDLKAGM